MPYSNLSPLFDTLGRDALGIQTWFENKGRAYAGEGYIPPPSNLGSSIVQLSVETGLSAALMSGLTGLESAYWQSAISRDKNNPSGHGAENDDPYGKATTFATPYEGLRVTFAHMMIYCGVNVEYWRQFDDRYINIAQADWVGAVRVLRDLEQRWAWSPEALYQAAPETQRYGWKIAIRANNLLESLTTMNPTDRMIDLLRARGHEVHDVRGQLPVNPKASLRYNTMPYSDVKYLIQHWTGDSFGAQTLDTIVGHPVEGSDILPTLSVADEKALLKWYANYHISKDNNTWGGIAYGTLVFPSGRIYVAWNIGTLTYHAFGGGNRQSYALCCPNANGAAPSPKQLLSLAAVWDILCYETPEIPAGKPQLLGHTEAKVLDAQNQTSCPGTFLPHVQTYRKSPAPSATPTPSAPDPNAEKFQNGNRELWIINEPGVPMLTTFRTKGGVEVCGLPMEGMHLDGDGVYRQRCENVELEVWPNGWGNHGGPYGRFGGVVRKLMEENERLRRQADDPAGDTG